jgi:hypothetical protein
MAQNEASCPQACQLRIYYSTLSMCVMATRQAAWPLTREPCCMAPCCAASVLFANKKYVSTVCYADWTMRVLTLCPQPLLVPSMPSQVAHSRVRMH